jgi:hypothetical protein
MFRTLTRSALALLLLALLPACDSNDDDSLDAFTGTYALATINGNPIPYTVGTDGFEFTFTSGFIRLDSGGTLSFNLAVGEVDGDITTEERITVSGTYTIDGSTITMRLNYDGEIETETGRISADTLTFSDDDGFTYTFRQ